MEKTKILITGKNNTIIDDCFKVLDDDYILISTSERYDDMNKHIDIFNPMVFICALNGETREDITRFVELKRKFTRLGISFILIGDKDECEKFQKQSVYLANDMFTKPIDASTIKSRLTDFVNDLRKEQEENRKIEEKVAMIKEEQRRKHVLVIDDDPLMLKLIKEYLHEDYDVATAISGKIAYKFLENKTTDLILLDYEMPVENGPMVLENLRLNDKVSNIPVIFLTGITDKEKIKQVLVMKPQGYLLKPIDREKLVGTIERFLG